MSPDPLLTVPPSTLLHDDWLVAMVCSLWDSRDRSAKLREIVELNIDPEEADTACAVNDGILFSEYRSKLQEDTMQCLDRLKEDNLGSQVSGWLEQFRTGPLQLMHTSTAPSPIYVYPVDYPVSEMRMSDPPSHNSDARCEELKQFLEDERYAAHHENIKTAISIYDEDVLPSGRRVWIQGGQIVDEHDLIVENGLPYWGEGFAEQS